MSLNLPDRLEPYRSGVFQEITVRTFPHWRKSCFSSQISVITNILLVLLVCRHLMNKLDLESFSKLCWLGLWSRSGALKFLLRMQQTKNNKSWRNFSFDFVQTFLVLSGTAERPWGSKIFNWQQEAKISFFFRRHFVSFSNLIVLPLGEVF